MSAPLIHDYQPAAPLLWMGDAAVSQSRFLAAVARLAARLPDDASAVLPLPTSRALFLLVFCAALLRGKPCLLPPAGHAAALASLRAAHPQAMVLSDDPSLCSAPEDLLLQEDFTEGEWLGAAPQIPLPQLAAIAFTSGSTGQPQPQAKTWAMLIATAQRASERFGSRVHIAATVPPQHMYGLETTVMMALVASCVIDSGQPFFADDIRVTLAALPAPRMLVTTPVHLRALVAAQPKLPPLALLLSATAALPLSLAQAAEQAFAAPVFEIYGCTEAGSLATRRVSRDALWRLYPGLHLSARSDGVWLSADYLETLRLADDIEPVEGDRFRLLGRGSEVVKVAGKRLDLGELLLALLAITGVDDAAVLMPDPRDEREAVTLRPAALVIAPTLSEAQMLTALAAQFDAVFLPRPLKKVSHLPRNAVGKLPRAALLELLHG